MTSIRSFKKKVSRIQKLWDEKKYDQALSQTEELRAEWPGNAKLLVLWASLVQLQEEPEHSLDDAKAALQIALELDEDSPAAAIELGHFLDAVEDEPRAAAKVFAVAAQSARQLLTEALLGQAKALLQVGKRSEAIALLAEAVRLVGGEASAGKRKVEHAKAYPHLNGPFAEEIENLLHDLQAPHTKNGS